MTDKIGLSDFDGSQVNKYEVHALDGASCETMGYSDPP